MIATLAVLGAGTAWVGVTLLAVAEAARGVALGLAVIAAGLALAAGAAGEPPPAVFAFAAGGLAAAALRLRDGEPGWALLPPGSTPRLIGGILVLIAAALVARGGLATPAGAQQLGAMVVAVIAAGRVLSTGRRWAALGAASALALGLGALGGPVAVVTGALVAAGLGAMDGREPAEAGG